MLVEENKNKNKNITWGARDADAFRVAAAALVAAAPAAVWMC
jgi:hypothetical protein